MTDLLVAAPTGLALAASIVLPLLPSPRVADAANRVAGVTVGTLAAAAAAVVLAGHEADAGWVRLDGQGAVFSLVSAVVGLMSALQSPRYLAHHRGTAWAGGPRLYYLGLYLFWAALLALPLSPNLGVCWVLVEATTGASALLVASSGRRRALEAGWKYLVLTTLGLTVTLSGIIGLYAAVGAHGGLSTLDWTALRAAAPRLPHSSTIVALVLILGGLAAKVGWAPVHHWLPDAHSEAPAPVSALLSSALLPTVMLVAWRVQSAVGAPSGTVTAQRLFVGFGLLSLAVAAPFLWRPLAVKRLLAYSSLEHVGILALGIGFNQPLALAGVVIHLWGHALAKSLGFYATMPLFQLQPVAARRPVAGIAHVSPDVGAALGISLACLSGLPPSPLFFSELFILLGGVLSGEQVVVAVALLLLALGFVGLVSQLVEGLFGRPRHSRGARAVARPMRGLTAATAAGLTALTVAACFLPGSGLVDTVARSALWPSR